MPELIELLKNKKIRLVTAESCTAGLLASRIASMEGASDVLEGGFVTYTNEAKTNMLGVPADIIKQHGAISGETAAEMAKGAVRNSLAGLAISITGVAGPASIEGKPVGLVYIGVAYEGKSRVTENNLKGDCESIKADAVAKAIQLLVSTLEPAK